MKKVLRNSLHKNQKGIVSFFVVMIIMIVLTLIVLAFSQLVRREQRQTLDRQLKTQALYAAESGINDAIDWISDPANQGDLFTWNDECDDVGSFIDVANLNNQIGGAGGLTAYSCLLVDPTPDNLNYDVPVERSAIFKLQPQTSAITRLVVSWQHPEDQIPVGGPDVTCTNGVGTYPGNGNQNCTIGSLRLEIVPFSSPSSRTALMDNRFIAYSQPGGTASINFDGATGATGRRQGQSIGSSCSAGVCRVTINNIPNLTLAYMRIGSIYRDADVTVEAFDSSDQLSMMGAQVEIDATGKANDVLHRIKVNAPIPIEGDGPAPEFALQTRRHQCKRFSIAPPSTLNLIDFFGALPAQECDPRL